MLIAVDTLPYAQGFGPLNDLLAKEGTDTTTEHKPALKDLLMWMKAAALQVSSAPASPCSVNSTLMPACSYRGAALQRWSGSDECWPTSMSAFCHAHPAGCQRRGLPLQADGCHEAAQAQYDSALRAAARHRHTHRATVAFIEERILQCYAALGDWDALKMQLASPQVPALRSVHMSGHLSIALPCMHFLPPPYHRGPLTPCVELVRPKCLSCASAGFHCVRIGTCVLILAHMRRAWQCQRRSPVATWLLQR